MFDDGVVGGGVENVVVAEVDCNVAHSLHSAEIESRGVGKKEQVAPFYFVLRSVLALSDLFSGGEFKRFVRSDIVCVKRKSGAVEFALDKVCIQHAVSPMVELRSPDVRVA